MIGASEGLYNYFNQNIREEGQEIEIKITKGAKSYTITDDDLVASSVKIIKKSVSGASFDIGECYVDSATFTINKNINNYKSLTGAKVTIRIKVNNTDLNLSENVLLGTFRILQDGIKRTNTLLQVTADSYISKFDKSRKRATFTGDLYDLVMDSCNKCKVTFGMTESAFRALSPNVAKTYEIKKDSSLKTHRDVIMYVSQLIGGFATTTPAGALIFKNYTSNNDVCNVNDNVIVNYSIGDEVYNLSGLGMSVKEKDVYLYREGEDDDSPYFLNLDTNPIMENCTDDEITSIVDNIWSKLIDLNLNNFSFEFNGNPLIEVGDIISIPERSLETYVASCEWTYHGKEKISCVSVDKNKRTETQREKQNENKPSNASKDDRVDDLIKNTTTKTRKVKKTLHTTLNVSSSVYLSDFNSALVADTAPLGRIINMETINDPNSDDYNLYFIPKVLENFIVSVDYSDFNTATKGIKAENIRKIIIDISAFKRYVAWGLIANNFSDVTDDNGNKILSYRKYFNIPTIPDSINYPYHIQQKWNNLSSLKNSIYELDYNGNIIGADYPDINDLYGYSTKIHEQIEDGEILGTKNTIRYETKEEVVYLQYKTESILSAGVDKYLDINNGKTIEITDKYVNDLYEYDIKEDRIRLNFILPSVLNLYNPTITIKSMKALREEKYYKNNVLQSSSVKDISNSKNGMFNAYSSNFTEDDTFNNTIEEKIKELNGITSIPVTIDYIAEENYTTTIEGTSNKINENADKTDKNADEIEQLKTDVKKNKANIDKLKQQVTSVSNKVGAMSNSLGAAKTDIAKLDIRVTKLESGSGGSGGSGMTDAQKKQLEQNTKEISTLKTTVSNNTKNISTNTTNLTRLTTRVTNLENSGGSSGSGSGITEAERQQIQTNKTDIANLTTRVTNLENSGGSGGSGDSGSGITEAERQQIQTNKQNIENLTLTVNGHTTSIEDILRRLAVLEQGGSEGGGETGEIFKFKSLNLNLASDNDFTFPSFSLNNYYFNNTYYLSNSVSRYFKMTVELTKPNTKQTFRQFYKTDGSQYYIIGTADTESLESSGNITFNSTNQYSYLDCISKYGEQQIISQPIKIYNYRHLSVTESRNTWLNTTTGNLVKTDNGAHIGDTISIPITYKYGFKAVQAENKPESINKYYYMINTTGNKESGNIVDWTEINAEPNVETKINFIYNVTGNGERFYLFVSDGQFTFRQDDYYITKLA